MLKVLGAALAAMLVAAPAGATTYFQDVTGALVYPTTVAGTAPTESVSLSTSDAYQLDISFKTPIILPEEPVVSTIEFILKDPYDTKTLYVLFGSNSLNTSFVQIGYDNPSVFKNSDKNASGAFSYTSSFDFTPDGPKRVFFTGATMKISILNASAFPSAPVALDDGQVYFSITAAPEPSTWALMFIGAAALGFVACRPRLLQAARAKAAV